MPRRYPDYADGYQALNTFMSYGSLLTVISVFGFIYLLYILFIHMVNKSRYNI
jgi:hypothetical protein